MKIGFVWTAIFFTLALLCLAGIAAAEEETAAVTAPVTETTAADAAAPAVTETIPADTPAIVPAPDGTTVPDASDAADDIAPYDGPVGPGNPLYGLKIAFEDLDESFTFNETERFNKQMNNARLRLSEAKREFILNKTDTADRALDLYGQKVNLTQMRLSVFSASSATGLLHAQEMLTRHQAVLERLMLSHPDNKGLVRAYSNSLALESRFEQKTQMRFERVIEKNNKTIVKAVRLSVAEQERTENAGQNQTVRVQQTQKVRQAEGDGKPEGTGNGKKVTVQETAKPVKTAKTTTTTPVPAATPGNTGNTGPGNTGNSDNDNRGQGNGRNR